MNTVDLHTHSTFSDGTFTPKELVSYGAKKGLSALALTDHDTLEGNDEAVFYGEKYGIEIIRGIEISTEYESTELHIVGLFMDNEREELISALKGLRESRKTRNIEMVQKLNEIGININYDEIAESAKGDVITRAHIAKEVIKKGYASSNNEVFDRYIGRDKPAYVKRTVLPWQDTLRLICESGGLPILAHPLLYRISQRRLEMILGELAKYGLAGIEAYYSTHSAAEIKFVKMLADKNRLKLSGGSDFHGENKPKLDLGTGYGNLQVPYEVLEGLKKELKARKSIV